MDDSSQCNMGSRSVTTYWCTRWGGGCKFYKFTDNMLQESSKNQELFAIFCLECYQISYVKACILKASWIWSIIYRAALWRDLINIHMYLTLFFFYVSCKWHLCGGEKKIKESLMIRNDVTSEPLSIIRFIKSKTNVFFFFKSCI